MTSWAGCPSGRVKSRVPLDSPPGEISYWGWPPSLADRGLLPRHAPEHQDAAPLPPHRPARARRCRPGTGYRRYGTDQIPTAQVIRRFRALDMPLEEIHAVLTTPDLAGPQRADRRAPPPPRDEPGAHPARGRVAARPARAARPTPAPASIEHRRIAGHAGGRRQRGHRPRRRQRLVPGRARRTPCHAGRAQGLRLPAPAGGIYANDLFAYARGEATVFVPCDRAGPGDRPRRSRSWSPSVELAVTVHHGAQTTSTWPTDRSPPT